MRSIFGTLRRFRINFKASMQWFVVVIITEILSLELSKRFDFLDYAIYQKSQQFFLLISTIKKNFFAFIESSNPRRFRHFASAVSFSSTTSEWAICWGKPRKRKTNEQDYGKCWLINREKKFSCVSRMSISSIIQHECYPRGNLCLFA